MAGVLAELKSGGTSFFRVVFAQGDCVLTDNSRVSGWIWFGKYIVTNERRGGYVELDTILKEMNKKEFGRVLDLNPKPEIGQTFKIVINKTPYDGVIMLIDEKFPYQTLTVRDFDPPTNKAPQQQRQQPQQTVNYNNSLEYWMNSQAIQLPNN